MDWLRYLPAWLRKLLERWAPTPPPEPDPPPPPPPPPPDDGVLSELLARHNAERARLGVKPLRRDDRLAAAAQKHADWMARTGVFSHDGENGSQFYDRARAAGYAMSAGSENIALGHRSAAEVVEGWMDSSGHRANVLSREWLDVGFGVADGSRGTLWVALFGAGAGLRAAAMKAALTAPPVLVKHDKVTG